MTFGGRSGRPAQADRRRDMAAHPERAAMLAARVARLVALRRDRAGRAQGRHRAVQFPAECRQRPARPPILSVFASLHQHAARAARPRATRSTCRTAVDALRDAHPRTATRRATAPTPTWRRAFRADDHVRRETHLAEIEAQWGPAPGRHQTDGGVDFRARRAFRQRLRRRPARLRLRGRPDAAAVRARLRADPRLRRLLPLAARGFRRPRGAAFRHAWRAGIHAGQAGRPVGRVLAGPADRRPAEFLSLCLEQSVRGHARQAPRRGRADQLSDAAGRPAPACIAACST